MEGGFSESPDRFFTVVYRSRFDKSPRPVY
jgi:hypothetical protein